MMSLSEFVRYFLGSDAQENSFCTLSVEGIDQTAILAIARAGMRKDAFCSRFVCIFPERISEIYAFNINVPQGCTLTYNIPLWVSHLTAQT